MHFGFMDVILLHSGHQHGHCKVNENKNTGINQMCPHHSLV